MYKCISTYGEFSGDVQFDLYPSFKVTAGIRPFKWAVEGYLMKTSNVYVLAMNRISHMGNLVVTALYLCLFTKLTLII